MGAASFGKYSLIAELGNGGMADVFLAVLAGPAGSGFRKLSVVKRLRQNLVEDPEFVAMLIEEARIAARLNHPNVVQTNEVGRVAEHYFIAMEYLDGQPLHRIQYRSTQKMKTAGIPAVPPAQQLIVLLDALAGLHHAHELCDYDGSPLEVVHRDVTPQNIFVTYDGSVKVVDFGIAKAAGRASETRAGIIKGKIRYMAPEQAMMRAVDRRADVFSVGIMLWEIVAGRRMWANMDDGEIVPKLLSGDFPASPRSVDPNVPEALDAICRRALAVNPDERYGSAEELRLALEEHLAETGELLTGRRKLATAVTELFEDKRATIRGVIEKQLAALDQHAAGEFQPVPMPPESVLSSTSGVSGMQIAPAPVSGVPASASSSSTTAQSFIQTLGDVVGPPSGPLHASTDRPPTRPRATLRRLAFGLAAVAAIVGISLVARVAVRPQRTGATSETLPVRADEEISLRVNSTPPARVTVDDEPSRPTPLDVRVKKDGKEHHIVVVADGYVPRAETVTFASNLTLSLDLVENASAAADGNGGAAAGAKSGTSARPGAPRPQAHGVVAPTPRPADPAPTTATTVQAPTPTAAPTPAPTTTSDLPTKKPRPKPQIDDGDPWSNH